jgi:hypothetical protein
MKKLYTLFLFACVSFFANAQCFVQVQHTNELCFGDCNGTAMGFGSGGTAPYTYAWSPSNQTGQSISGLCAGTYTCVCVDAVGCTSQMTFTVTQPAQIVVSLTPTNASCQSCCDGFITSTVSGGTPGYTYLWTPTNQTSPTLQSACAQGYTLCVTDANGCQACSAATVSFSTAIAAQNAASSNLELYPNPAADFVTIKENFDNANSAVITVSNILGETIFTKTVSPASELNEKINLSGFDSGVYFISVKTQEGTSVKKFVKK